MSSHIFRAVYPLLLIRALSAQALPGIPFPLAVAVDAQGSIYLAGNTTGADLATTAGVFQPAVAPGGCTASTGTCTHGFVAKVSPSGDRVMWATYLTGVGPDSVTGIAVAADGNIYVAGTTTSATLVTGGNPSGVQRLFVAKLSSDGKSVLAGSYFGGSGSDSVSKLVVDSGGSVFLAGTTASADFPTTPGAYQRTLGAGAAPPTPNIICVGDTDQFLAKFDATLKTVLFSTLIGTPGAEQTWDFAIGPDGSLYIAGARGPLRNSSCTAGLLTRLNPQGSAAVYSVWFTGSPVYALAVDSAGAVYLASDNRVFGVSAPEATISKIDSQGNTVATARINGWITSLTAVSGDIGILGASYPGSLTPTADGPRPCFPPVHYETESVPYVARLNAGTLAPTYTGYLTASRAWLAAPDRVVAANPYSTLLPYAVLPAGPPAAGTVTCIADAADFKSRAVAPGEIISLFGRQIGPAEPALAQPDAQGIIGPDLAGVRVLANGASAPLLFASPGQINLVLPFGLTGDKAHLELYRDNRLMAEFDVLLVPQHWGAFAAGTPISGPLAALNQNGTVNSDSNPALPGSIVSIFVTGLGVMTPQLPDGAAPPLAANTPVMPTYVYVNEQRAEVLYVGNAPTLVQGVVQINLRVPNPIPASADSHPPGLVYVALSAESYIGPYAGGTVAVR